MIQVELNNMCINIGTNSGSEKNGLCLLIVVKAPSLASTARSVPEHRHHCSLEFMVCSCKWSITTTVIPRLTKLIRSGITLVSRKLR